MICDFQEYYLFIPKKVYEKADNLDTLNNGAQAVGFLISVLPVGTPTYPPVIQNLLLKYTIFLVFAT